MELKQIYDVQNLKLRFKTKKALEIAAASQNPVNFKKALAEAGISNKKYRKELTDQLNAKFDRFKSLLDRTGAIDKICLLYTSPSPRDVEECRKPSYA